MKILVFICSIVYLVAKVKSLEVCESYIAYNGLFNDANNCSRYCCGLCNDRYCCTEILLQLNQTQCTRENCTGYYDKYGYHYYEPKICIDTGTSFCCGDCDYRNCCANPNRRLNQSSCAVYGPNKDSSYSTLYYVLGGISIFLLSNCACIIWGIIAKRKLQKRSETNNNVIRLENPGTQTSNGYNNSDTNYNFHFVVADNSQSNSNMNFNNNIDLPPSYDTINVEQKNAGKTN